MPPSLAAAARCLRCDWTAEGDPDATDKAAEKHTTRPPRHPTATVTRWAR